MPYPRWVRRTFSSFSVYDWAWLVAQGGGLPVVPSSKIGGQGVGQDVFKWAGEGEAE